MTPTVVPRKPSSSVPKAPSQRSTLCPTGQPKPKVYLLLICIYFIPYNICDIYITKIIFRVRNNVTDFTVLPVEGGHASQSRDPGTPSDSSARHTDVSSDSPLSLFYLTPELHGPHSPRSAPTLTLRVAPSEGDRRHTSCPTSRGAFSGGALLGSRDPGPVPRTSTSLCRLRSVDLKNTTSCHLHMFTSLCSVRVQEYWAQLVVVEYRLIQSIFGEWGGSLP